MKIQITLKDPDSVHDSVYDAAKASAAAIAGLSPNERDEIANRRHASLFESLRKWIQYGEYVTIEIDTDTDTATVIQYK